MEIKEITGDNFQTEVTKAAQPVLLEFYADGCSFCKAQLSVLEEAAEEARAKSYGLSVQEFKKKLIKIAFKYNVSLENLSYQPANKTVSFTDASGTTKVVNILTAEVVS